MKSLAEKQSSILVKEEERPYYPSLSLKNQFPELLDKKIGSKFTFTFNCRLNSISKYGSGEVHIGIELLEGELIESDDSED